MSLRLEEAGLPMAGVLSALQSVCFPDEPWSAESIATLLKQPGCFARIALRDDGNNVQPMGFILARVAADDAEVLAIGVLPTERCAGTGTILLNFGLDEARKRGAATVFLEVAEDNDAGRALYAASGFRQVGRRPGYYKRPGGTVAALVLSRSFTSEH